MRSVVIPTPLTPTLVWGFLCQEEKCVLVEAARVRASFGRFAPCGDADGLVVENDGLSAPPWRRSEAPRFPRPRNRGGGHRFGEATSRGEPCRGRQIIAPQPCIRRALRPEPMMHSCASAA